MSDRLPYKSLSSIARMLLPRAERMHSQGMTWREVAARLKISPAALFIWKKLERAEREHQESGALVWCTFSKEVGPRFGELS